MDRRQRRTRAGPAPVRSVRRAAVDSPAASRRLEHGVANPRVDSSSAIALGIEDDRRGRHAALRRTRGRAIAAAVASPVLSSAARRDRPPRVALAGCASRPRRAPRGEHLDPPLDRTAESVVERVEPRRPWVVVTPGITTGRRCGRSSRRARELSWLRLGSGSGRRRRRAGRPTPTRARRVVARRTRARRRARSLRTFRGLPERADSSHVLPIRMTATIRP